MFTCRKCENWCLQIEIVRTGVYRLRVWGMEFTDWKYESFSLQIESVRTGVHRLKVGELEFVNLYFFNK